MRFVAALDVLGVCYWRRRGWLSGVGRRGSSWLQTPVTWWHLGTGKASLGPEEQGPVGLLLSGFGLNETGPPTWAALLCSVKALLPLLQSFCCLMVSVPACPQTAPSTLSVHTVSSWLPAAARYACSCSQTGSWVGSVSHPARPLQRPLLCPGLSVSTGRRGT